VAIFGDFLRTSRTRTQKHASLQEHTTLYRYSGVAKGGAAPQGGTCRGAALRRYIVFVSSGT